MTESILDKRQRAEFSQDLRARYAILKKRQEARYGDAGAGGEVRDTKDEASAAAVEEVRVAGEQRDEAEMVDIEQALARMHADTYGVCVECGQAIGVQRLKAYPTAKRCRVCQERRERRPAGR